MTLENAYKYVITSPNDKDKHDLAIQGTTRCALDNVEKTTSKHIVAAYLHYCYNRTA